MLRCCRFFAASDAALEEPGAGTGGFLFVWCNGVEEAREGFVATRHGHLERSYCLQRLLRCAMQSCCGGPGRAGFAPAVTGGTLTSRKAGS